MRKRVISILQYIFFLGGGLFLVWWQLRSMSSQEKAEFNTALSNANYWLIFPIALMGIASHISRAMRWMLMMEPMGYQPKLKNVFSVTMIGYLANSAIPRLGEVLKCTFLARYEKMQAERLIGTIIIERTFDMLCYIIFVVITVLIQIDQIGFYVKNELSKLTRSSGMSPWLKLTFSIVVLILIILISRWMFKKFPNNSAVKKIKGIIMGVTEGLTSIKKLKNKKAFILHTLFIWAMYLLQIYIGFKAMAGIQHLSIQVAFSVLALSTLAIIITPGGIGSFPIFVMQTLLIYGIGASLGKAFGWLMWGVSTSIVIITGLICLILLPYINRQPKNYLIKNTEQ
ncbi:MAG: flippase-like domain-containing protein [Ferruginibacter sp.]|nr:flippase-like domain-containing protein [Ferruginibacter sp.]